MYILKFVIAKNLKMVSGFKSGALFQVSKLTLVSGFKLFMV